MNRFLVSVSGFAAALLLLGTGTADAQARFGYIDSQRILMEAPGTSDAQSAFEQDMEQFRTELERLEGELETLQENFDRQQGTLSTSVRQERQQELQEKFMEYQQRRTELETTAQERQAELVAPIMERIEGVIEQIRAEGDYAMIFDAATGVLVGADPQFDLTDQVLQRLQTDGQ